MTTTISRPSSTRTPTADVLRVLLEDALEVVADDAVENYSSRTPAGRTLLSLAAMARRAAGALGAEGGTALTAGPGVVVQRETAAAARLLDQAAEVADGDAGEIAELLGPAQRLYASLIEAVPATRR